MQEKSSQVDTKPTEKEAKVGRKIVFIHATLKRKIKPTLKLIVDIYPKYECMQLCTYAEIRKIIDDRVSKIVVVHDGTMFDEMLSLRRYANDIGIHVDELALADKPPIVRAKITPASKVDTVGVPALPEPIDDVQTVLNVASQATIEHGRFKEYLRTSVREKLIKDKIKIYGLERVIAAVRGVWLDSDPWVAEHVQSNLEATLKANEHGDNVERFSTLWIDQNRPRRRGEAQLRQEWVKEYSAAWDRLHAPAYDPTHPLRRPHTGAESLVIDAIEIEGFTLPRFSVSALTHFGLCVVAARIAAKKIATTETEKQVLADDVRRIEERFNQVLTSVKRRLANGEIDHDAR